MKGAIRLRGRQHGRATGIRISIVVPFIFTRILISVSVTMVLIITLIALIIMARRILPHAATLEQEKCEGKDDGNGDKYMQSLIKSVRLLS